MFASVALTVLSYAPLRDQVQKAVVCHQRPRGRPIRGATMLERRKGMAWMTRVANDFLLLSRQKFRGRLPDHAAAVSALDRLAGVGTVDLNPRLYGKPLASLPKAGTVLLFRASSGKPSPDFGGELLVALYRSGKVEAAWLTPQQAKGSGLRMAASTP